MTSLEQRIVDLERRLRELEAGDKATIFSTLTLRNQLSPPAAQSDGGVLYSRRNVPHVIYGNGYENPLGYSPPWLIAPHLVTYMAHSYKPTVEVDYIMRDFGLSAPRNLSAQATTGHAALTNDETVIGGVEYYGVNSSNLYFQNISGLSVFTTARHGIFVIMWFHPNGTGGVARGLYEIGTTTPVSLASINTSNRVIVDVYDSGNTLYRVTTTNTVNYDKWNYLIGYYYQNVALSVILNGVTTTGTTPPNQTRVASGAFRLGHTQASGTLNGQIGWVAFGLPVSLAWLQLLVDLSRPWHDGGA